MRIERHASTVEHVRPLQERSEKRFREVVVRGTPVDLGALSVLGNRAVGLLGTWTEFNREHSDMRLAVRVLGQARLGAVLLGTREGAGPKAGMAR